MTDYTQYGFDCQNLKKSDVDEILQAERIAHDPHDHVYNKCDILDREMVHRRQLAGDVPAPDYLRPSFQVDDGRYKRAQLRTILILHNVAYHPKDTKNELKERLREALPAMQRQYGAQNTVQHHHAQPSTAADRPHVDAAASIPRAVPSRAPRLQPGYAPLGSVPAQDQAVTSLQTTVRPTHAASDMIPNRPTSESNVHHLYSGQAGTQNATYHYTGSHPASNIDPNRPTSESNVHHLYSGQAGTQNATYHYAGSHPAAAWDTAVSGDEDLLLDHGSSSSRLAADAEANSELPPKPTLSYRGKVHTTPQRQPTSNANTPLVPTRASRPAVKNEAYDDETPTRPPRNTTPSSASSREQSTDYVRRNFPAIVMDVQNGNNDVAIVQLTNMVAYLKVKSEN